MIDTLYRYYRGDVYPKKKKKNKEDNAGMSSGSNSSSSQQCIRSDKEMTDRGVIEEYNGDYIYSIQWKEMGDEVETPSALPAYQQTPGMGVW